MDRLSGKNFPVGGITVGNEFDAQAVDKTSTFVFPYAGVIHRQRFGYAV